MTTLPRCKAFVAWSCVIILASNALYVHPVYSEDVPDLRIKRMYTDEDAPPEIRFRHLLRTLSAGNEGTRDRATRRLEKMGFDADDVPRVRAYLDSVYNQAQAEIDEGIWRLACHSTAASLDGLAIRVVYNSFDDLRYGVAAKYLAIASAELASMGYPDFQYMISGYPGSGMSFKTVSTDHRFAWGETDDRIQQNREAICQNLGERLGKTFD